MHGFSAPCKMVKNHFVRLAIKHPFLGVLGIANLMKKEFNDWIKMLEPGAQVQVIFNLLNTHASRFCPFQIPFIPKKTASAKF